MRHHSVILECSESTNPITSNNFCNSLVDLMVGYSHPQGVLTMLSQSYPVLSVFTNCFQFFFSSFHQARFGSTWQGMFFIDFRVISHEFALAFLGKPCGFFPWFLTGVPFILYISPNSFC